eukprot:CAMPEP_0171748042 /NCGR_PEP_ID=MMETSP0991-20121206/39853_1 /TAXON_ID=483369 /ORGANISM="non described non described, Strain CCMP2098" /LENGTH=60 /DNA_ID=CAMNT_0012348295 /DNA_START=13 /DNA_END=195 /DNA_ORIENTATION=-
MTTTVQKRGTKHQILEQRTAAQILAKTASFGGSILEKPAGWKQMSKGEKKRWRKRARPSV